MSLGPNGSTVLGNCTGVKSGMSMENDSHLERCLLVQTAELYSPGKYVNWNLSFFMESL